MDGFLVQSAYGAPNKSSGTEGVEIPMEVTFHQLVILRHICSEAIFLCGLRDVMYDSSHHQP